MVPPIAALAAGLSVDAADLFEVGSKARDRATVRKARATRPMASVRML